jgi:hypothetical protein
MPPIDTSADFTDATKEKIAEIEELIEAMLQIKTVQVAHLLEGVKKIRYGVEKAESEQTDNVGGVYSGREKWHLEAKPDFQTGRIRYILRDYSNFKPWDAYQSAQQKVGVVNSKIAKAKLFLRAQQRGTNPEGEPPNMEELQKELGDAKTTAQSLYVDKPNGPIETFPDDLEFGHNMTSEIIAEDIAAFMIKKLASDEQKEAEDKGISVEELPHRDSIALAEAFEKNRHSTTPTALGGAPSPSLPAKT